MTNELVQFGKGVSTSIPSNKSAGRFLIETDTGNMYLDISDTARVQIKDSTKASKEHYHSVSSLTDTLPISQGGTGATDRATALYNLAKATTYMTDEDGNVSYDLNLYTDIGYWYFTGTQGANLINAPETRASYLIVFQGDGENRKQIWMAQSGNESVHCNIYVRNSNGSNYTWTSWTKITTGNDLANYLALSGGEMTAPISSSVLTNRYLVGNQGTAIINSTADAGAYVALAKMNSTNGYFTLACHENNFYLMFTDAETVEAGTNAVTHKLMLLNESGDSTFPGNITANGNTVITTADTMTGASSSTAGASGLVPTPAAGKQSSYLRGDGKWAVPTNTTYTAATSVTTEAVGSTAVVGTSSNYARQDHVHAMPGVFGAASSSTAGSAGFVPAPTSGKQSSYLRGDGTWAVPTNTYTSAYCTTAAATAAKVASCTDYALLANTYVHVTMKLANTSATALTLNINGKGAKPIYINGKASGASNYTLPAGTYLVYYDGTNYYFETDGGFRMGSTTYDLAVSPLYDSTNYPNISVLQYAKLSDSTDKFPILWVTNTNNNKDGSGVCLTGKGLTIVAGGENAAQGILNNAANKSGTSLNGGSGYISPQTEELILAADAGISAFVGGNSSAPNVRLLSNDSVIVGGTSGNSASPGANSLEFGTDNTASGTNSLAFGSSNTVSGNFSGCIGTLNQVTGTGSYAIGSGSSATGSYSLAIGDGLKTDGAVTTYNSASGGHALAFGYINTASGNYSVAIGRGATASAAFAMAIGSATNKVSTASAERAISLGCGNTVSGIQSMSIGNENTVSSNGSYAFGLSNTLSNTGNTYSMAFGRGNTSTGVNSYAIGGWNTCSGELSTIIGNNNTVSIDSSFVLGSGNETRQQALASANHNMLLGWRNKAYATYQSVTKSVSLGYNNTMYTTGLTAGIDNIIGEDSTGYQDSSINDGYCIAMGCESTAARNHAVAIGYRCYNDSAGAFVCGRENKHPTANSSDTASTNGDVFIVGNGYISSGAGTSNLTHSTSNAFRVTYAGATYAKAAYNSSGADYAEFVKEWYDGNPNNEDRVGYMVTIGEDNKLHKANEGDYIIGITSGNPSVVGNADEDYFWMYERDEFNRPVYEDVPDIEPKLDENGEVVTDENGDIVYQESTTKTVKRFKFRDEYDPSLQDSYIQRADRPEWDYVGMRGVIPCRDDGTCEAGGFCKCGVNGIATKAETQWFNTYYVIERISDSVISIEVK